MARCETGPVRFGDDWPGVFIRGDSALYYASHVRRAADVLLASTDGGDRHRGMQLSHLASLLFSCQVADGKMPGEALKDYLEVRAEPTKEGEPRG